MQYRHARQIAIELIDFVFAKDFEAGLRALGQHPVHHLTQPVLFGLVRAGAVVSNFYRLLNGQQQRRGLRGHHIGVEVGIFTGQVGRRH
ncbi:hypothetical protein, partial [Salmonella enterica]